MVQAKRAKDGSRKGVGGRPRKVPEGSVAFEVRVEADLAAWLDARAAAASASTGGRITRADVARKILRDAREEWEGG
jgi:hypothetical protein